MDIVRVQELADQLASRAEELGRAVGLVDSSLSSLRAQDLWIGPDFDDAESSWRGLHRPSCLRVVEQCRESAVSLRRQAAEQAEASDETAVPGRGGRSDEMRTPPSRIGLLEMADGAYQPPGKTITIDGMTYTPVTTEELRKFGIAPADMVDPSSGFAAVLYRDENGAYVLSFAGTADPQDWRTNLEGASPAGLSRQAERAVLLAGALAGTVNGPLSFTGHSLGGRLAALASIRTGKPATTFNAAGVSDSEFFFALEAAGKNGHLAANVVKATGSIAGGAAAFVLGGPGAAVQVGRGAETWDLYSQERASLERVVTNVTTSNDALTSGQQGTGLPDAVGTQVVLPSSHANPVAAHQVEAVREALRRSPRAADGGW